MSGEHMLPRVFYSVASPNSRDNATPVQIGTCPARAEEMAAPNVELVPALCSHGPMGRLFQEKSRRNRSQSRGYSAGFTLVELLVTVGVLVVLVLLFTQLLNSAASITTLGHKQMDADSQARELLDRMAIDLAQMVKRPDVDYYLKSSQTGRPDCSTCTTQIGTNDQIAFYCATPGYYSTTPAPTPSYTGKSPISLVSYRVNSDNTSSSYNRMERMGKGLAWNGASSGWPPILFLDNPTPTATPTTVTTISGNWPAAVSSSTADSSYEVIGPQVFRFEYYYLLKSGSFSATPWDTIAGHTNVSAMSDVAAIITDIAVIDPKSKVLLTNAQIANLAGQLGDYSSGMVPGQLLANWRSAIDANSIGLPRQAISGIRLYERFIYLSPPTLGNL
jgi:type II secretory pathway pseudopilin PulG